MEQLSFWRAVFFFIILHGHHIRADSIIWVPPIYLNKEESYSGYDDTHPDLIIMRQLLINDDYPPILKYVLRCFGEEFLPYVSGQELKMSTKEIHSMLLEHCGIDGFTQAILFQFLVENDYRSRFIGDEFIWILERKK